MTFLELLRKLEDALGFHQFPLYEQPQDIKRLFECSPLHHDLIMRLVRSIYAHNDCQRLSDPVGREQTFAALAPIRVEVLRAPDTDVDEYRLIDDLCLHIENAFRDTVTKVAPAATPVKLESAQIIPLAAFRRSRRRMPKSA